MDTKNLLLEEIRDGLLFVLETALGLEADDYVHDHRAFRDARGRALVARNGRAIQRTVPIGPLSVDIRAPRVNDRRVEGGVRQRFVSVILPPNRSPRLGHGAKLATAYLHGLATGDFSLLRAHVERCDVRRVDALIGAVRERRRTRFEGAVLDGRYDELHASLTPLRGVVAGEDIALEVHVLSGVRYPDRYELLDVAPRTGREPRVPRALFDRACARGIAAPKLVDETVLGSMTRVNLAAFPDPRAHGPVRTVA